MAGIYSINVSSNIDTKKMYSKLSFNVGEKFAARVVNTSEDRGTLTLKLSDGWEFQAQVEEPLDFIPEKQLIKFEVEGYNNGKLQIKLIKGEQKEELLDNSLDMIFEKENILKNDENITFLNKMIKHNIPLTKENIVELKNLFDFSKRLNLDPQEGDKFIKLYLASKNINIESERGKEITNILKNFFAQLKDVDLDTLLTLKEIDVVISEENIKSFNSIDKEDNLIYNILKNLSKGKGDFVNTLIEGFDGYEIKENTENIQSEVVNDKDFKYQIYENKDIEITSKETLSDYTKKGQYKGDEDVFQKNDKFQEKNSIENHRNYGELEKYTKLFSENVKTEKALSIILQDLGLDGDMETTELMQELKNTFGDSKVFDLEEEFNKDSQFSKNNVKLSKEGLNKENVEIKSDDSSKNGEPNKYKDSSGVLKNSLDNVVKSEINEVIKMQSGKQEDNSLSTIQKNENNKGLNNLIKNENNNENIKVDENKSEALKGIAKLSKEEIVQNFKIEFLVKEQIKDKIEEMKNIIRNVLDNKMKLEDDIVNKVMKNIDQKINDFKVFNSISNEYYYLDTPLNIKDKEYPCKLIIKDDRKKGKKVDGKNVRLVTSIKTSNLGVVDAYIKVFNENMDIDMRCEKDSMKVLQKSKIKLEEKLSSGNYNVLLKFSEKQKEVNLVNCREFFEDNSLGSINIRV